MIENEQNVFLKNRNEIRLSGIVSVDSFDEFKICATTICDSIITVDGENLAISEVNLDEGVVEAKGNVIGVFYEDKHKVAKIGFFKGLFGR